MLTYLRYALATVCFALSVACLGLWWRSFERWEILHGPTHLTQGQMLNLQSWSGTAIVMLVSELQLGQRALAWKYTPVRPPNSRQDSLPDLLKTQGPFGIVGRAVYFPLWYPALVFALAGVGALRLGRRFTLRSAIVVTTVVAGLLGLVAAL